MSMIRVSFSALGHENIVGTHKSTMEITKEANLTPRGDCIVGVRCSIAPNGLSEEVMDMATKRTTIIELEMRVGNMKEIVIGHGSAGLTYKDSVSMVTRTSEYECDRTLMVCADKAAADLSRKFIDRIARPDVEIDCELRYLTGP